MSLPKVSSSILKSGLKDAGNTQKAPSYLNKFRDEGKSVLYSILNNFTLMVQQRAFAESVNAILQEVPFGQMFGVQAAVMLFDENLRNHGWHKALVVLLKSIPIAAFLSEEDKQAIADTLVHYLGDTLANLLTTKPESLLAPVIISGLIISSVIAQKLYFTKKAVSEPATFVGQLVSNIVSKIISYQSAVLPHMKNFGRCSGSKNWAEKGPFSGAQALNQHNYVLVEHSFLTLLTNYLQLYWPFLGVGGTLVSVGTYTGISYVTTEKHPEPVFCYFEMPTELIQTAQEFQHLHLLPEEALNNLIKEEVLTSKNDTTMFLSSDSIANLTEIIWPEPITELKNMLDQGSYSATTSYLVKNALHRLSSVCSYEFTRRQLWGMVKNIVERLFLLNLTTSPDITAAELMRLNEGISRKYIDSVIEKPPSDYIDLSEDEQSVLSLYLQSNELYPIDSKEMMGLFFVEGFLDEDHVGEKDSEHEIISEELVYLRAQIPTLFSDTNNTYTEQQRRMYHYEIVYQIVTLKKSGLEDGVIRLQIRKSLLTLLWDLQAKMSDLIELVSNSPIVQLKGDYRDIHNAQEKAREVFEKKNDNVSEDLSFLLAATFYRFWLTSSRSLPGCWSAITTIQFFITESQKFNPMKFSNNVSEDYMTLIQNGMNLYPQGTREYVNVINGYIENIMGYHSNDLAIQLIYSLENHISTTDIVYQPRRLARYQLRDMEGYLYMIELHSGNWLVLAMIEGSIKIKHYNHDSTRNEVLNDLINPLENFGYINDLCGRQCSMNYLFYPYDIKISEMRTPGVYSETPSDILAFEAFWSEYYKDEEITYHPRLKFLHISQPYKFSSKKILNPFVKAEDKGLKFILESAVSFYLSEVMSSLKRQPPQSVLYKIASTVVPFYDVIHRVVNDRKYTMTPFDIQSIVSDSISVFFFAYSTGTRLTNNLAKRIVRSVRENYFRGLSGSALTNRVLNETPGLLLKGFSDTLPSFLKGLYRLFEPAPLFDLLKGIQMQIRNSAVRLRVLKLTNGQTSQLVETHLRFIELQQPYSRYKIEKYLLLSSPCQTGKKHRKRGALLCSTQRIDETSNASNRDIINAFYQSLDDILYADHKIEVKRNYLIHFEAGIRNHHQPDYDWLEILTPRQKLIYFNAGIAPERFPRELGPAVRGALSEKIIIDLERIEAAGTKHSVDAFFNAARVSWGGSETLYLPQSTFIKGLSPGLCKPLSSLMALALENGRMLQFADALKSLNRQSELYQFLEKFHRGGEAPGIFKNSLFQSGNHVPFTKKKLPQEMHFFSDTTSSAEISTSVHAMSVTKKHNDGTVTYLFFDPNFGVVSFSQYEQMTGFIAEHLASLKLKSGNPYHFHDELLVKKINFNSAEYMLRSSPEVHKILI